MIFAQPPEQRLVMVSPTASTRPTPLVPRLSTVPLVSTTPAPSLLPVTLVSVSVLLATQVILPTVSLAGSPLPEPALFKGEVSGLTLLYRLQNSKTLLDAQLSFLVAHLVFLFEMRLDLIFF